MPRAEIPEGLLGELLFDRAAIDPPAFVDTGSTFGEPEQRGVARRAGHPLSCGVGVVVSQAVLHARAGDHRFAFWARPLRRLVHAAKVALASSPSTLQADQNSAKADVYLQQYERGRVAK